jgi:hypothetical protein
MLKNPHKITSKKGCFLWQSDRYGKKCRPLTVSMPVRKAARSHGPTPEKENAK